MLGLREKRRARLNELRRKARKIVRRARGLPSPDDSSLVEALRELMSLFPSKTDSWFERAVIRVLIGVKGKRGSYWLVPGLPELGDKYALYGVTYRDGKYVCDCYLRMYGRTREKVICTHVAAVMLARRQRKLLEYA